MSDGGSSGDSGTVAKLANDPVVVAAAQDILDRFHDLLQTGDASSLRIPVKKFLKSVVTGDRLESLASEEEERLDPSYHMRWDSLPEFYSHFITFWNLHLRVDYKCGDLVLYAETKLDELQNNASVPSKALEDVPVTATCDRPGSSSTSFLSLPPELLFHILQCGDRDTHLTLSHVNSALRATLVAQSQLWSYIDIMQGPHLNKLFLERSGTSPLTISITAYGRALIERPRQTSEIINDFVDLVGPHQRRIVSMNLTDRQLRWVKAASRLIEERAKGDYPPLKLLDIGPIEQQVDENDAAMQPIPVEDICLRFLPASNVGPMFTKCTTSITLVECPIQLRRLVHTLRGAPNLKKLVVQGLRWPSRREPPVAMVLPVDDSSQVQLVDLEQLEIHNLFHEDLCNVAEMMHAPNLTRVSFTFVNDRGRSILKEDESDEDEAIGAATDPPPLSSFLEGLGATLTSLRLQGCVMETFAWNSCVRSLRNLRSFELMTSALPPEALTLIPKVMPFLEELTINNPLCHNPKSTAVWAAVRSLPTLRYLSLRGWDIADLGERSVLAIHARLGAGFVLEAFDGEESEVETDDSEWEYEDDYDEFEEGDEAEGE